MVDLVTRQRIGLADLLSGTAPGAPTLCEGWDARDLAAHLVVRDRRAGARAGSALPQAQALAARAVRARAAMRDSRGYPELVELFRQGPPRLSPLRIGLLGTLADTFELAVHGEDVRRAQPAFQPVPAPAELEWLLWRQLRLAARVLVRRSPVGIILRWPQEGSFEARGAPSTVTVSGAPLELTMFAFGRQGAASAELDGPGEAVERLRAAPLGV
ncbi:MAG: TIGR03085 family metal-binding protein [Acidimicrobiales bacterium]